MKSKESVEFANLQIVQNLSFSPENPLWNKNSATYKFWMEVSDGKNSIPISEKTKISHPEIIDFIQGMLLFVLLTIEGLGFSSLQLQGSKSKKQFVLFLQKGRQINLTPGHIDKGFKELLSEFNQNIASQKHIPTDVINKEFINNCFSVLNESRGLIEKSKDFLLKLKKDNLKIDSKTSLDELLVFLSLLPPKQLQNWVDYILEHLPQDFISEQSKTDKALNKLEQKTPGHSPFELIRRLLFHYQRKTLIEDYIVEQKSIEFINTNIGNNKKLIKEVNENLYNTLSGLLNLRLTILEGFLKLLKAN